MGIEIIQSAKKGDRKAMEMLYERNKQKVYYLSYCLIGDDNFSIEATYQVFKHAFLNIGNIKLESEYDFVDFIIKKTVYFCKRKAMADNSKAFRMPANRIFTIKSKTVSVEDSDNDKYPLKNLPFLQRFIFVMQIIGGYSESEIEKSFKYDRKTVACALDAQKDNVEMLVRISGKALPYDLIIKNLKDMESVKEFPYKTDDKVRAVIDSIATPVEKKRKKKTFIICASVAAAVLVAIIIALIAVNASNVSDELSTETVTDYSTETTSSTLISSPVIDLEEDLTYYADIDIADYGTVTVKLDQNSAPITVSNFVNLANSGFYNGLTFHRIIEDFMMQGGDPYGDGTGGNYDENGNEVNIVGEFTENGYENNLSHTRGAISMARSSDYDSGSSQFFIVHEDSTYLDGQYAVFGYVTSGLDIVDLVCESAEPTDDNGTISSSAQPIINSITIRTE